MSYINEKNPGYMNLKYILEFQSDKYFIRFLRQSVVVVYHLPGESSFHRINIGYYDGVAYYHTFFEWISVTMPCFYKTHSISDFYDVSTFLGMHCSLRRLIRLFSDQLKDIPLFKHIKTI